MIGALVVQARAALLGLGLGAVLAATACSGSPHEATGIDAGGPDATTADASPDDCAAMQLEWYRLVENPGAKACRSASDCALVGATYGCECDSSIAGCGLAANQAAYVATGAAAIEYAFLQDCGSVKLCDCGPHDVGCEANVCVLIDRSCFPLPDAGAR